VNFALFKELAQQYRYCPYSLQAYHHVIKTAQARRATMSARDTRSLLEKLKSLPPQRQAEVEDFVDFFCSRDEDRHLATVAAKTSEPAFAAIRDNNNDAEYDRL
jgi:hypothetical protein